jgi:hypothetical protein
VSHADEEPNTRFILPSGIWRVQVQDTLRRKVSRSVCPGTRPPSGTCDQFLFLSTEIIWLPMFYYVISSLTRGWDCNLLVKVLLGLASADTHGSKSRSTWHHMLLSHLRGSTLFIASYDMYGYAGGILTCIWGVRVRVRVTLRLTVGQSVCLGVEPCPGLMTRCLLTLWNLRSCLISAPSLTRGRVCPLSV